MCGGARRYSRFGTAGLNDMSEKLWKIEIRYHADDNVEHTVSPEGVLRHRAEKIEDGININLDHERFYTEIVELPS
jgi:hypothetical protein